MAFPFAELQVDSHGKVPLEVFLEGLGECACWHVPVAFQKGTSGRAGGMGVAEVAKVFHEHALLPVQTDGQQMQLLLLQEIVYGVGESFLGWRVLEQLVLMECWVLN